MDETMNKIPGRVRKSGMVLSYELTYLWNDEDTLDLLPGMTCPTMTSLKRIRVTERIQGGGGTDMPTIEVAMTEDEGAGLGTITATATRTTFGTYLMGTSMIRGTTRDATIDVGQTRIPIMSVTADRRVGGVAGPSPAPRYAIPEAQVTRLSSRGYLATYRSMRLVPRDSPRCLRRFRETCHRAAMCTTAGLASYTATWCLPLDDGSG